MTSVVSIRQCDTYDSDRLLSAIRTALDDLGGLASLIAPGQRVLLKPNLLAPKPTTTTDPRFVEAVARLVMEVGAKPVVADSCAIGSIHRVAQKTGLSDRLEALGIPLQDMSLSRPGRSLDDAVQRPQLSSLFDDVDAVINLPKVKVHQQCYLTLAVKNLYGCVPGRRKALWHFKVGKNAEDFARMLVANCRAIAPVLTIADGIVAMERFGPMDGDPKQVGLITASTDPFATDRVWVDILGANPERHLVLKAASEMGLGDSVNLDKIPVAGTQLNECRLTDFRCCAEADMMPVRFSLPHIIRGLWRQFWFRRKQAASASA